MNSGLYALIINVSMISIFVCSLCTLTLSHTQKALKLFPGSTLAIGLPLLLSLSLQPNPNLKFIIIGALSTYLLAVSGPIAFGITNKFTINGLIVISLVIGSITPLFMYFSYNTFLYLFSNTEFLIVVVCVFMISFMSRFKMNKLSDYIELGMVLFSLLLVFFTDSYIFSSISLAIIAASGVYGIHLAYKDEKANLDGFKKEYDNVMNDFFEEVEKSVRQRTLQIERVKDKIAEVSKKDHLTGALNRKSIVSELDNLIFSRDVTKFIMLILDIDNFKTVNDTLGHTGGDSCLKTLIGIANSSIRDIDMIGRYGGDEFIILLPNITLREGIIVAERFRKNIEKTENPNFTISIGVSAYPWDGNTFKDLLEVADKGLYASKAKGRNKVQYAGYLKPNAVINDKLKSIPQHDDNVI